MPIHKTIHQFTVCIVLYKKSSICEKVFVIFVQWNAPPPSRMKKKCWYSIFWRYVCVIWQTRKSIFLYSFPHFLSTLQLMNISSSIKIVPKVFGNKILWYYITMKEGDLALEKLVQDPSLKNFLYCVRPWKCLYITRRIIMIIFMSKNCICGIQNGLFYGNLIPFPAVVIRLVGNNNHHFRWVIHDSANIILFLLKGCCAEV